MSYADLDAKAQSDLPQADTSNTLSAATGKARKVADGVVKAFENIRENPETAARDAAETARAHLDRAAETVSEQVKSSPLVSALALMATGVVVGYLLRGKR